MALSTSYLKPSHPSHALSIKLPSSSSSPPPSSSSPNSSSIKLKTLIQTFIISHLCRFVRALSKARSILIQTFSQNHKNLMFYPKKATKNQKKIFFGSFRLHYNWCSSHVFPVAMPMTAPDELCEAPLYYDSTWNSVFSTNIEDDSTMNGNQEQSQLSANGNQEQSQLSAYLQWLEEKVDDGCADDNDEKEMNEIDRLADMFIASCHEKFRLEKVESYRRFQEMLARSL